MEPDKPKPPSPPTAGNLPADKPPVPGGPDKPPGPGGPDKPGMGGPGGPHPPEPSHPIGGPGQGDLIGKPHPENPIASGATAPEMSKEELASLPARLATSMLDANGTEIKVGDVVAFLGTVIAINPQDTHFDPITVESINPTNPNLHPQKEVLKFHSTQLVVAPPGAVAPATARR